MANGGSTKPTYSELEAENLRVRGLLQRLEWAGSNYGDPCCPECWGEGTHKPVCELDELLKSGVEMGNVNRVEEKSDDDLWMGAICAECENGDRPYELHGEWIHALSEGDVPCPAMPVFQIVQKLKAGSAETGGEKAAPCSCRFEKGEACNRCNVTQRIAQEMLVKHGFSGNTVPVWKTNAAIVKAVKEALATFRRCSQNQTVSSGVEGAHEGTTADEKAESREPEKLNNAPLPIVTCPICHDDKKICDEYGHITGYDSESIERNKSGALAESSLSHEKDLLKRGFEGLRDAAIRLRDESSLSSPPSAGVINVEGEEL